MTLEPASAIAAAKCLASRLWTTGLFDVSSFHPRPCAWEDWSKDALVEMLRDFNLDAAYDIDSDRYSSTAVERFRGLHRTEQARLVAAAQYPEEAAA